MMAYHATPPEGGDLSPHGNRANTDNHYEKHELFVATAASFAAGKGARHAYSVDEDKIDFVSGLGVDKVCK